MTISNQYIVSYYSLASVFDFIVWQDILTNCYARHDGPFLYRQDRFSKEICSHWTNEIRRAEEDNNFVALKVFGTGCGWDTHGWRGAKLVQQYVVTYEDWNVVYHVRWQNVLTEMLERHDGPYLYNIPKIIDPTDLSLYFYECENSTSTTSAIEILKMVEPKFI